jgi:RNA polymerase sigma-70 factor (sigma-E family)
MTGYEVFEDFVVARRDALLRTAYLLAGNHHDAEDLVQSTLIKVVPKWSRIKGDPERYVRQVLARESVNRWRGRRWREMTTDAVPETHSSADSSSTDSSSTERIALLDALRTLSPRQRAVLVLRYFEDLTEADTAAVLGISVGTVKSYAREALTRMRDKQADEEQARTTTAEPWLGRPVLGSPTEDVVELRMVRGGAGGPLHGHTLPGISADAGTSTADESTTRRRAT